MNYSEWELSVPTYLTGDPLWRLQVYRLALFALDISWPDVSKLSRDTRTRSLSDQLYRAIGSIGANIAEGYGKNSGKDRARFYEYSLGSAREARTWYFGARHILGTAIVEHRCDNLTRIIRLLLAMLSDQHKHNIREEPVSYLANHFKTPKPITQQAASSTQQLTGDPMNLLSQISQLDFPANLPSTLLEVEQRFDAPKVNDIAAATIAALNESGILDRMTPGDTVAVGAGSRGIANLPAIVKATVDGLRAAGMKPFVMPAMGSHGGATAEGQKEMLAFLGVTEESVGAEVRATMEVEQIGRIENGPPLYQGKDSMAADHAILVSRIKPHTDFRSHLESGPSKMCVIGLGKQFGAAQMHSGGGANFQKYLAPAARVYETHSNFAGAICPIENAYDDTAKIVGLTDKQVGLQPEADLLQEAKDLLAGLPFDAVDVLVVRDLGKNISGTGMDTNIVSRLMIPRQPEAFGKVDVAVITVLDFTEETHGNASGLGLANVTTARVAEKIDWQATYMNAVTSGIFGMYRAALPLTMPNDRQALNVSLRCCAVPQDEAAMVFIRDTLTLDRFYASPSLRATIEAHPRLTIAVEVPLAFDEDGNMVGPWVLG